MTQDELKTLISLLQKLTAVGKCQQDNYAVTNGAANLLRTLETRSLVMDCKKLLEYMDNQLSTLSMDDEAKAQEFYSKEITIGFGDMVVKIYNNAYTFDSVQTLLEDFIADYEQV